MDQTMLFQNNGPGEVYRNFIARTAPIAFNMTKTPGVMMEDIGLAIGNFAGNVKEKASTLDEMLGEIEFQGWQPLAHAIVTTSKVMK